MSDFVTWLRQQIARLRPGRHYTVRTVSAQYIEDTQHTLGRELIAEMRRDCRCYTVPFNGYDLPVRVDPTLPPGVWYFDDGTVGVRNTGDGLLRGSDWLDGESVMSTQEIEEQIARYEELFGMSSAEFQSQRAAGVDYDSYEAHDWSILLRYRQDD